MINDFSYMNGTRGPLIPVSGYNSSEKTAYSGSYLLHRPDRLEFKVIVRYCCWGRVGRMKRAT